jgi:hypothetical protein
MYFLKIISLGPHHQRILASNLILNTNKIKKNAQLATSAH